MEKNNCGKLCRDLKIKEAWKEEGEKEGKERGRGERRRNKGVW